MTSALLLIVLTTAPQFAMTRATVDRPGLMAGPIAASVRREAIRLALERQPGAADSDWARVRALDPETPVTAVVKGGRSVTGTIVRVDESQLIVRTDRGGDFETIRRGDIDQISLRPTSHPVRTGALIGAAAGAVVGYVPIAGCSSGEAACSLLGGTLWVGMFAGIGAGAGAGIGALIHAVRHQNPEVIYSAP